MEIDLFDFIGHSRRLTKQALGKHAGYPDSGGSACWIHVVLHCIGSKASIAIVKRRMG
jgi:hypothetical protein